MLTVVNTAIKLVLSAIVAGLVAWADEPVTGVNLPWWVCALIGLAVVFGGVIIFYFYED